MTEAGAPMTHDTISKIESGARRIYHGEAVLFAGVLEVPFVRLSSPLEGEEVAVRVDPRRPALRPIELRNWFVYGHRWTPAHQDAQHGMQFAQAAYARLRPRDERQRRVAGKRLVELLRRR